MIPLIKRRDKYRDTHNTDMLTYLLSDSAKGANLFNKSHPQAMRISVEVQN